MSDLNFFTSSLPSLKTFQSTFKAFYKESSYIEQQNQSEATARHIFKGNGTNAVWNGEGDHGPTTLFPQ